MCNKERSENLSCAIEDRGQILLITEKLISDVAEPTGSVSASCSNVSLKKSSLRMCSRFRCQCVSQE